MPGCLSNYTKYQVSLLNEFLGISIPLLFPIGRHGSWEKCCSYDNREEHGGVSEATSPSERLLADIWFGLCGWRIDTSQRKNLTVNFKMTATKMGKFREKYDIV
jgi:hypothetical protein